jgi:hypothetical protein
MAACEARALRAARPLLPPPPPGLARASRPRRTRVPVAVSAALLEDVAGADRRVVTHKGSDTTVCAPAPLLTLLLRHVSSAAFALGLLAGAFAARVVVAPAVASWARRNLLRARRCVPCLGSGAALCAACGARGRTGGGTPGAGLIPPREALFQGGNAASPQAAQQLQALADVPRSSRQRPRVRSALPPCAACDGEGATPCTRCDGTGIANRWLFQPSGRGWGPRGEW